MSDMVRLFILVLPALIPSWEFFKTIEPSPRIQWRWVVRDQAVGDGWQDFRPRPKHLSLWQIVLRLFWNPDWNEGLYAVSLAERLTLTPSDHSVGEIRRLIAGQMVARPLAKAQFRLLFVQRDQDQIRHDITYVSDPFVAASQ